MKNKSITSQSASARPSLGKAGFSTPRVLVALMLCAAAPSILTGTALAAFRSSRPLNVSHRTLTFSERVTYQRAIEEVYWRHRIWPKENSDPKPSLDAVMSQAQLEKKVKDYLRNSQQLEDYWQQPITADQLQGETDRMVRHTRQPEVLRELFEALGNDPFVVAECLARPIVAERTLTRLDAPDVRSGAGLKQSWIAEVETKAPIATAEVSSSNDTLPSIASPSGGCTEDTWTSTSLTNVPSTRAGHTAVWTGTEMIVWGGIIDLNYTNTGGKYNPSTDSWTATNTTNAPTGRGVRTAVWTGSEMIIWGGYDGTNSLNTGGKYNPSTDSWTATSITNAPAARNSNTAVWSGSEMIVWGGGATVYFNSGGRYNPSTNSWTTTSITNAPAGRVDHTAVWTGSEMIVWGGSAAFPTFFNTGGKYNPNTDSWTATSTTNVPAARDRHTAVLAGNEMIVWGGSDGTNRLNTGGRYDFGTDSWALTSIANAPTARYSHTAVGTGSEMIVWGGTNDVSPFNTGGRYNPSADTWTATSTANAANARYAHTAVWTGGEMIVWGGIDIGGNRLNTGGRYCAPFVGSQLGNISTRAFVQTGDNVVIGGFIVQGNQTKRVIIRAIGPELGAPPYNVPNPLYNPSLELHDSTGALIASNDNWQTTIIGGIITSDQVADIQNSGYAPGDGRESAIIGDLAPGNYTAIVRGVANTTGVALVEMYDISGDASSILGNISTRSFVQTGDNVMIGGFIVQGSASKNVIIRAIGPELTPYGVPDALADPTLELHDSTGALIASNDNWQHTIIGGIITADQVQGIVNSGHAPIDPGESAIIANLPAGNYTAIVRGISNTTGVALVEVYDLGE